MSIQVIQPVMPSGIACDLRALPNRVMVGESIPEGDVADGVNIASGAVYVVTGEPSSATIGYDGTNYSVGQSFTGGTATSFTRSTSTARIVRVKEEVTTTQLALSWYIVSGASGEYIEFNGQRYTPGSIFRGLQLNFAKDSSGSNVKVFEIENASKIETLGLYHFGSRLLPNEVDYSQALGINNFSAAAIPAQNLNRVYFWNYGSSDAELLIKSYVPSIDRDIDAARSDSRRLISTGANPWIWVPTEPFRQGGEGNAFGETEEDRRQTVNAFIFQTADSNTGIWIKPETNTLSGLM